jgi:hypothetical protein
VTKTESLLPPCPLFARFSVSPASGSPIADRGWQSGEDEPPTFRLGGPCPALDDEEAHRAAVAAAVAAGDPEALIAIADEVAADERLRPRDRSRVRMALYGMAEQMAEGA